MNMDLTDGDRWYPLGFAPSSEHGLHPFAVAGRAGSLGVIVVGRHALNRTGRDGRGRLGSRRRFASGTRRAGTDHPYTRRSGCRGVRRHPDAAARSLDQVARARGRAGDEATVARLRRAALAGNRGHTL
jgi:hypothetical protein